ncbi:unnamed protein product [Amoebophrya sp. A120]|nr:unnamed protein product [Amoebophrya sp. A120]|eukprot:GSA120T00016336001.1
MTSLRYTHGVASAREMEINGIMTSTSTTGTTVAKYGATSSGAADFIPKRVLFTGGCGFIGSNVLRWLVTTYPRTKFVNLDKLDYCGNPKNIKDLADECANYWFVRGDICDRNLVRSLFEQHRFDCVFHFAALSHVDRSFTASDEFVRTNVNGTHVLLEAAIRCPTLERFIHVSTDEVYGDLSFEENRRVSENDQMLPTNPYSASKAAAECLVRGFSFSFRLPSIVVRPNNVFGPRQWPEKLIPKSIALFNRNMPFPVHGDGTNTRSFLFIDDVVSAFDVIMRKGTTFETYNISQPQERSNLEVLKSVLVALGKEQGDIANVDSQDKRYFQYVKDRAFNDKSYLTTSVKLEALGWKVNTTWEEGLQRTVDWYLENPNHFGDVSDALQAHYGVLTKQLHSSSPSNSKSGAGGTTDLQADQAFQLTPSSSKSKRPAPDELDHVEELPHFSQFAQGKKF